MWTASDDAWLEDLFVMENARRTGLGRAMVLAAIDRAEERNCRRIELDVDDVNEAAVALYKDLGFAEKHGGAAIDGPPALRSFAALLAGAVLVHQLWWTGFTASPAHSVLIAAAIWSLGDPGRRLRPLAAVAVVVLALDWPRVSDHLLIVLAACVGMLLRPRWDDLAPLLRGEAILLYAAAAFAKLNTDFLDPAVSSAVPMAMRLPLAGDWVARPAIYGTIGVEASLAVLLAVPRTRRAGVVVGLLFHAVLALAGNVPFAAVMAAVYVAFVPGPRVPRLAPLALGGAWLLGVLVDPAPGVTSGGLGDGMRWTVAAALVVAAVRVGPALPVRGRMHPALGVILALLALNAAAPYLGLKRQYTFAPFSDLRTRPGDWNHLLVPEAVRVGSTQRAVPRGGFQIGRKATRSTERPPTMSVS